MHHLLCGRNLVVVYGKNTYYQAKKNSVLGVKIHRSAAVRGPLVITRYKYIRKELHILLKNIPVELFCCDSRIGRLHSTQPPCPPLCPWPEMHCQYPGHLAALPGTIKVNRTFKKGKTFLINWHRRMPINFQHKSSLSKRSFSLFISYVIHINIVDSETFPNMFKMKHIFLSLLSF